MAKAYEELELNRCSEDTALTLNDGTVKIFLNTKGTLDYNVPYKVDTVRKRDCPEC